MLIDAKEWTVVSAEVSPENITTLTVQTPEGPRQFVSRASVSEIRKLATTLHPLGRLFGAVMLEVMAGVEEAKSGLSAKTYAERRREKKRRRRAAVAAAGADLAYAAGGKPPDEVE